MQSEQLLGKSAIVTGGASGMGAASAHALAAEGARVVVADLDSSGAERVAAEIRATGREAVAAQTDVTSKADVASLVDTAINHYQTVDILACIAGVLQPTAVANISEEEWRLVLDVNLSGVFLCAQAVLPIMQQRGGGKIVIMGSMAGRATSTLGGAHYTASKAGVLGFMRHLARETASFGINVNAINPGIIDTPMIHLHTPPEQLDSVIEGIPFKRMGSAHEVADLVVFLSSERSAYITGASIDIHGGEIII